MIQSVQHGVRSSSSSSRTLAINPPRALGILLLSTVVSLSLSSMVSLKVKRTPLGSRLHATFLTTSRPPSPMDTRKRQGGTRTRKKTMAQALPIIQRALAMRPKRSSEHQIKGVSKPFSPPDFHITSCAPTPSSASNTPWTGAACVQAACLRLQTRCRPPISHSSPPHLSQPMSRSSAIARRPDRLARSRTTSIRYHLALRHRLVSLGV